MYHFFIIVPYYIDLDFSNKTEKEKNKDILKPPPTSHLDNLIKQFNIQDTGYIAYTNTLLVMNREEHQSLSRK